MGHPKHPCPVAEYCHYLAESTYEREFKIWNDIMLDLIILNPNIQTLKL